MKTTNDHPTLVFYHEKFNEVIGKNYSYEILVKTDAHEGPVYVKSTNELYYTTVPHDINIPLNGYKKVSIKKVCLSKNNKIETVQELSNMANGMTMDLDKNLLVCEQGTKNTPARISKLTLGNSQFSCIVDNWFNLPFNSPNDIIVKKDDGSIWFTDPAYGYPQGFKHPPQIGNYVYRYDIHSQQITVVADAFKRPNGLAFSPDQKKIYINDSSAILGDDTGYHVDNPHHIKVFDILDGQFLANERLFAVVTPGIPDGLKTDLEGRVYSSCASGVKVYDDKGILLGEIVAPGTANFCFGGKYNNQLFICNDKSIIAVQLAAVGANDYN